MPTLTIEQSFELALEHHGAGRLDDAELLYRQILDRNPRHADALHYLGVAAYQRGRLDAAKDLIQHAIAITPGLPEAFNNLGNVLRDSGKLDEALAACRQAVALDPEFAEAWNNLGNVLKLSGQLEDAIAAYRRSIALDPGFPETHNNLGMTFQRNEQWDEAITAFRQAIALKPDFAEVHYNLGVTLRHKEQVDEAIAAFDRAIELRPAFPEAIYNLAVISKDKGQLDEAVALFRKAIALQPSFPEAINNLGAVLYSQGLADQAIEAYRQAIALKPKYAEPENNLGIALAALGQLDEAIATFHQAIAHKPNFPEALSNLGIALKDSGQLDQAVATCRQAIALRPDFAEPYGNLGNILKDQGLLDDAIAAYRQAVVLKPRDHEGYDNLVYTSYFHPGYDAQAIAKEHHGWSAQHAEPLKRHIAVHANDRRPDRRLRIGYVTPDFRAHPVGRFMLPLLAHHDHQSFEIFAYADVARPDETTALLRSYTDVWRSLVGISDSRAAELIREDQIDILVDLVLHMSKSRLLIFARKPAPVQVTYLAYAGTSGLTAMDYRISDPYLDPPGGDESVYTEQTIRLPETYWCYEPIVDLPVQPTPALNRGFITFGCLNNFSKVNEPLLALWARLLSAVPNSRLLLHAQEGAHRQRVLEHLHAKGIDRSRVSFAGSMAKIAYFARYHSIDIALDTHPYGGGTTTCDALWMGVPVVSLVGKTAVGRGGLSILSNIGLPELVAHSEEQYVSIASDLAGDLPSLEQLRSTLRQRMQASPLMNAPQFARNVEVAYRQMWRIWCAGGAATA